MRANFIPLKVVECVMGRVDTIMAKGILDCISVSRQLAFYNLGSTFFGDAFLDWPKASMYEELLMTIAKDGCFWASYTVPPFWSGGYWKYQYMCKTLKHLTQDIIQHCVERYNFSSQIGQGSYEENKGIKKEAKLDASILLDNISGGLFQEEMEEYLISKEEPCGNILSLMFHGCLATASLISSILTRLVLHPELQKKVDLISNLLNILALLSVNICSSILVLLLKWSKIRIFFANGLKSQSCLLKSGDANILCMYEWAC